MSGLYAVIIGAGVVGLSVASRLAPALKGRDIMLIEKAARYGMECSSHNSEVIHASIYYRKGSLKAQFCARGNELMYDICKRHSIPYVNYGKLIVATDQEQANRLPSLMELATNAGAKKIRILNSEECRQIEPSVQCVKALWCPTSGVVDSDKLMAHFEGVASEAGCQLFYGRKVVGIRRGNNNRDYVITVQNPAGQVEEVTSQIVINCAGHGAPGVSKMAGIDVKSARYEYHPTKGIYYRVNKKKEMYPKALVYPMPAPGVVGIHTCPDLSGGMRLGPFDRWIENFNPDHLDYSVDEGMEEFFAKSVRAFLPFVEASDLSPDSSGIHPKYQRKDQDIQDFIITHEIARGLPNFINLIGIESPGLTSSPAIGEYVLKMVQNLNV